MTEIPEGRSTAPETPSEAPFSSKVEQGTEHRQDEPGEDTLNQQEPAAGVTDVRGNPLAGSSLGGAMGS